MEKVGWLTKEGGSIKTWKRRFFVLKNGKFSYSRTEKEAPIDTLDLNSSSAVRVVDRRGRKHCFEIVTPTRIYAFSADSEYDQKAWVDALSKQQQDSQSKFVPTKATLEDFDLLNLIGKGSFGKVLQVRKKDTKKIYAMKILDKRHILETNEVEHTLAEKLILQKVHHPFLVNLHFSFQSEDKLYFVLDFVNGGEMFYHLQRERRFSEERVRFYCAQILLALEHLHNNGIIYRDLKPENILLTADGNICLTDFGLSKTGMKDTDRTDTFCGTPEYLAPEVLKGKGYGKEVDWWSFGSLMYEMLCGLPPFYSQNVQEMYTKIISDKLKFPANMGENARNILEHLLQRDLNIRLKDPSKMKEHPFFSSINWDDLYNKKVKPPYIPNVKGEADTGQIDPTFLQEKADISPSDPSYIDSEDQKNFEGFTYVNK